MPRARDNVAMMVTAGDLNKTRNAYLKFIAGFVRKTPCPGSLIRLPMVGRERKISGYWVMWVAELMLEASRRNDPVGTLDRYGIRL
jgi:enoyl-[acyl-carrier-protein] reductase (NADH)